MITMDTSALFALLNRRDPDHDLVKTRFLGDGGPHLVPAGILSEIGYLIERRLGIRVLEAFIEDLDSGAMALECGDEDLGRMRELVARYSDMGLGLADASVVACAERNGGKVLTLDFRHFRVVAGEAAISLAIDE